MWSIWIVPYTVIHVQARLRPWRFAPVRSQAASVLELPCHIAAETKTSVGDRIEITLAKDRNRPTA